MISSPEEIERQVALLSAWRMAARELLCQLIASAALREDDVETFFRALSDRGDDLLDHALSIGPEVADENEEVRSEKDSMIVRARTIAAQPGR